MTACVTVIRKKGRGPRTQATMAKKWISRALRVLAHSDDKHSKDLPARQDQILPDTRAAQREAVKMNACVTVIGGKGRLPLGRRVPEWRGGGVRWGGATSPPAAEWRGGGGPGKRAASPPAAGCRVGGVRGEGPPLPLAYNAAPQSSNLRTENELFPLWKRSRFYRPGGTFCLSLALCISGTAAVRTNLSSANGGRGEAWANFCKLLNELGRVVVWRFHENASVGHVRKYASIYCGLSEPARVLPSPFI